MCPRCPKFLNHIENIGAAKNRTNVDRGPGKTISTGGELSLNKVREPVLPERFFIQVLCTLNHPDAGSLTAAAFESLIHIPFSRRVEKGKLISFCDGSQGNELTTGGIKKTIGFATVIHTVQVFRQQYDVLILAYLNRQIIWL